MAGFVAGNVKNLNHDKSTPSTFTVKVQPFNKGYKNRLGGKNKRKNVQRNGCKIVQKLFRINQSHVGSQEQ